MEGERAKQRRLTNMFCTCEAKPLGLDFILTAGCLVHDHCVCHDPEHRQDIAPGASSTSRAPGPGACMWCDAFVVLLQSIAELDGDARKHLQRLYREKRLAPPGGPLSAESAASLQRGLADVAAGRVAPLDVSALDVGDDGDDVE